MSEPAGVVLARDDGVVDVPNGIPVVNGFIDAIERLLTTLGVPQRNEREQQPAEDET